MTEGPDDLPPLAQELYPKIDRATLKVILRNARRCEDCGRAIKLYGAPRYQPHPIRRADKNGEHRGLCICGICFARYEEVKRTKGCD